MGSMNQESAFVLLLIPVRHEIRIRSVKKSKLKGVLREGPTNKIEDYAEIFVQRFKEEILIRSKLV